MSDRKPTGVGARMYGSQSVYDAALDRIRWLFDEFPNVIVNVSGGKDSTVILHLALQVARERDRLPLPVYWLDQEAEWQATVDIVGEWMRRPDVEPLWLQVPFRIFNATSATDHWLHAWDPAREADWVHPHDPLALTENVYGTDRFAKLFSAVKRQRYAGQKMCAIAGVRCEESPTRRMGLTHYATYKWVTWGTVEDRRAQHFTFYPIFDWSYVDVWKAILDNGWSYNHIYDVQYQHGIQPRSMRVSNLHHETAVSSLFHLQQFEPETYERLAARIGGIDMAGKLGAEDYFPRTLPFMFDSWREYRDYLLAHLVDDEYRPPLARRFNEHDRKLPAAWLERAHRVHVTAILTHDWEGVKLSNWFQGREVWAAVQANKPQWMTRDEVPVPA